MKQIPTCSPLDRKSFDELKAVCAAGSIDMSMIHGKKDGKPCRLRNKLVLLPPSIQSSSHQQTFQLQCILGILAPERYGIRNCDTEFMVEDQKHRNKIADCPFQKTFTALPVLHLQKHMDRVITYCPLLMVLLLAPVLADMNAKVILLSLSVYHTMVFPQYSLFCFHTAPLSQCYHCFVASSALIIYVE